METQDKSSFIDLIKSFNINTEYVVVKPNWVDDQKGNFTEAEILDWLFEAFPSQKKIVIESYTPWRGLTYEGKEELGIGLKDGKKFWEFYKKQDKHYLEKTRNGDVLKKHHVEYVNITDEYWSGSCVDQGLVRKIVEENGKKIRWQEFYSYIPKKLFDIRNKSTLISLAKVKTEESYKNIMVSLSIKNLFGLIPHPSRRDPFHGDDHNGVMQATLDIFNVYTSLFNENLWINEGIKTLVRNYESEDQEVEKDQNLIFVGTNPFEVDKSVCEEFGVKLEDVPIFNS